MATKKTEETFRTSIGGQALIEGIMMRGPKKQAIAVRKPDGEIEVRTEDLKLTGDRHPILKWPIIRGTVNLLASMVNGVKALTYSAQFMPEEEQEEPSKLDKWIEEHFSSETAEKLIIGLAVVLGVGLAVVLFFMLPTFLASLLDPVLGNGIWYNLVEGVIRMVIFIAYIWLVSRMKDIRRVWMYHGAEHKTIFCYEAGLELTPENAGKQPRCHPRCGTSFMILVMLISILVFSLVRIPGEGWNKAVTVLVRMGVRILLLPVVIGLSYELIKYAGRHDNWFTKVISAPGKALQRLTTAEPDVSMLEVAIAALKPVLPETKGEDRW